ncbi:RNA polymerase subunit sigma-24 [Microbacterium sp. B35-04]|uniref:RNA polymerase sigma-70 factor n=1 Tax=unclassified Microbacterium TaxID=2609290 RepID=UPI0013D3F4B7|nr:MULTISPECIES: RNA polymerase sigma-70 factor [unclassified Microbacterium]KAF2413388.1 RNA polymerase subunit sigma-24 [Microbacterium sp. B35-04]KAF2419447.1 RNA polymerase subunit sigma-24 [Microbacterium sp. B35-30]
MGDTTRLGNEQDDITLALAVFDEHRRRIFGIAYRMLGTVADAEDIVQETWIRWQNADRADVREPAAFLATVATRLSINATQSAHARRETYIGPWLPEPVNTDDDPALGAERGEALQFAILLVLEKLTPTERAAYILREALDYPYERIADVIGATVASARQLVSRARKHLESARRAEVADAAQRRLLEAFLVAAQKGDVSALEQLFAEDVVSTTDGNGVKLAARIPVAGRSRVAKFIAAFSSHFWIGKTIDWVELNGQPAATISEGGVVTTVAMITATDDGIRQIHWIMSPDKLGHVAPVGA